MKPPYLPNEVVGNFTIIKCKTPNTGSGLHRVYEVRCNHCGKVFLIRSSCIKKQDGCGCTAKENLIKRNTKHGHYHKRLYHIWYGMIKRCDNATDSNFCLYGGRGIKVCKDWHNYENFEKWAKFHNYKQTLSLDRIDVNGNYEPENCRWIAMREQATNKRNSLRTESGTSLTEMAYKNDKKGIRNYGLKIWPAAIKKIANHRCEICGKPGTDSSLDAHHWYVNKASFSNTDLLLCNGACLCRECHIKAHANVKEYKEKIAKIKNVRNFLSRMDKMRTEEFDIKKGLESIKRIKKVLKS